MNTHADKTQENKSQSVAAETSQMQGGVESTFQFADNRPEAIAQRKLQGVANNSPQVSQLKSFQDMANNSPQARQAAQLHSITNERAHTLQLQSNGQGVIQFWPPYDRTANNNNNNNNNQKEEWVTSEFPNRVFPSKKAIWYYYQPYGDNAFTLSSAQQATQPIPRGEAKKETGRDARSGVNVGDVGSYGYVQYLEQVGDGLTGDHQPSGAAIKESIREMLHNSLNKPLTRGMARNAYKKAITIVMTDVWHKLESRTYGGRNTKAQIISDSQNLMNAALADWKKTEGELRQEGFSQQEIDDTWKLLCQARENFFKTGNAQSGNL